MNHLVVLCREKTKVFITTEPFQHLIQLDQCCTELGIPFYVSSVVLVSSGHSFAFWFLPRDFSTVYTTRSQPMCRRKTAIQWVLFKPIIKSNLLGTPSLHTISATGPTWQNQTICQSASFDHKPAWYLQDESLSHDYFALLSLTCTSLHDYPMQIGHTFVMVRIDRKTILKLWHILVGKILRKHIQYTF